MTRRKPSVISLFTGAGGMDLGLHAAGLVTAVAVGEADVLIGGPPCQPFSKSGYWAKGYSDRLSDPRANTLAEFIRVFRDARPKAFLLENVSGLAYTGKEEGLRFLLDEIDLINTRKGTRYKVAAKVLNAASYGVPQTRERIILVGSRDGREFKFPNPSHCDPETELESLIKDQEPFRTAWDALGDLADPDDVEETCVRGQWADLLPSIPEGLNYLHHTDRGKGLPLFGWRRRYWSFLLKLSKRRPAWTLTAQPGPAIGPFHWKNRRLARTELLRLQTFPDGYRVIGTLAEVHRQVGNAVPSALAESLALEIRRQLLDERVPSRDATLLPPKRLPIPSPEPLRSVPRKYRPLAGIHDPH